MSRLNLIDKDALMDKISVFFERNEELINPSVMDCVEEIIKQAESVDAVEVSHGEWETYDSYKQTIDGRTFDGWSECSKCRTMYPLEFSTYNYCPNCGTSMDGEVKDDE